MITITRQNLSCALRAALQFVCEDETRFHLCAVSLEVNDGALHVVATNGHTLCNVRPVAKCGEDTSFLLSTANVETLISWLKYKKTEAKQEMTLDWSRDGHSALTVSGVIGILNLTGVNEKFPPFRQVTPSKADPKGNGCGVVGTNPEYLGLASLAAKYLLDDARVNGLPFEWSMPPEPLDPIRLDYTVTDRSETTIIIMPMMI
jgi:hypothetical protein